MNVNYKIGTFTSVNELQDRFDRFYLRVDAPPYKEGGPCPPMVTEDQAILSSVRRTRGSIGFLFAHAPDDATSPPHATQTSAPEGLETSGRSHAK